MLAWTLLAEYEDISGTILACVDCAQAGTILACSVDHTNLCDFLCDHTDEYDWSDGVMM